MTDITGGHDPEWQREFDCEFGCMPMDHGIEPEGAWQCGNGHMFRYEPPPASPPWCARAECYSMSFIWILRDEATDRDWLPDAWQPVKRHDSIITLHGVMEIIPPGPLPEPRELSPEGQREAAQRYMQKRYADQAAMYWKEHEHDDLWVNGGIMIDPSDAGATAVHEYMTEESCLDCGGPRADNPRTGCHRNDFHYNFSGQQPTAKEYRAMVSRNTDGPDPLVPEP